MEANYLLCWLPLCKTKYKMIPNLRAGIAFAASNCQSSQYTPATWRLWRSSYTSRRALDEKASAADVENQIGRHADRSMGTTVIEAKLK